MKTATVLALLSTASMLLAQKVAPVVLNVQTNEQRQLLPSSAFELRFAETMVEQDQVGKAGEDSPLVIKPAIAGKWTWVSPLSGVFTPTEAPQMGTTFQVSLRPDLKTAAGKPFRGTIKESVSTAAFRVKGFSPVEFSPEENASALPKFVLCFSADVDAASLANHFTFTNDAKEQVAAKLEHVDLRKTPYGALLPYRADDRSSLTWEAAFQQHLASGGKPARPADEDEDASATPADPVLKNQLVVSPAKPLPPGKGWRMVVAQGTPSSAGGHKLAAAFPITIGEVKAFTVESVATENLVYTGKRATIRFNKELAKSARKDPAKLVTVEPAVPNLRIESQKNSWDDQNVLYVRGDFELGKDYTLSVSGEVAAKEPFTLGSPFTKVLSFAPISPRLYFQEFSTHQQRSGARKFHLMGVNVRNVRITAKLIPADSVLPALAAWAKYYKEDGPDNDEWLQKIDDNLVPGTVVWKKDFPIDGESDSKKLLSLNWDEIIGAGKNGVVLLTAEQAGAQAPNAKRAGAQALVQVTDLGVVWKNSGDSFCHVFSLTTAQPAAGATLSLFDQEDKQLATVKVAADGTARLPDTEGERTPKWLVIAQGSDQLVVNFDFDRGDLEFGRFRINVWGEEEDIMVTDYNSGARERGLMFTDRPVYRPGETAHVKAIVRSYEPGKPRIPAGAKAKFRVDGPRNQIIFEQEVKLSETGAFSADVPLPPSTIGTYSAQLVFGAGGEAGEAEEEGGDSHQVACYFSAQEYQPNAFEVKVIAPKLPLLGAPLELPIAAKYYMGKPLSKAQLAWNVRASDEVFRPEGYADFSFTNALSDWRLQNKIGGETRFSAQGRVDIAQDGSAKIAFTAPRNSKLPQPRRVVFSAEITDINQQTVAERSEFTAHSSDFYLGIRNLPDVVRAGDALPLQVVAVRTDGSPMPDPVQAEVKLTRLDWQTNRVEEADEAENFRSEAVTQLVASVPLTTAKLVRKGSLWTTGDDNRDTSFKAEKPGLYLLSAVAKDSGGRDVITMATVYVYGKDQLAWNYRNRFQVELVTDKAEYRPGEEATVLVKTPISGPALVTIERENVKRHFFTKLEGNAPAVKVPIEQGDAPNVFVSVLVLRGSQDSTKKYKSPEYRIGFAELKVTRADAKLYVNVRPSKPAVQPGEEVELACEVRDADGKPVAGAEVTLWAADEGVLSLTGFDTPDPLAFFSTMLRLDVTTGLTLERLLGEDPDERVFENKGYLIGGGFGKGGDVNVRRNFLGTAYWNAALKTDADGKVSSKFTAPDGLTRYRVMAVVQNTRDQFGNGESAFEVNKPLMIEPSPPRFANVGDQMIVRAVLHNTTANAGEAAVRVTLDGTATAQETEKKVQLPANGSVAVDFPVTFAEPGEAHWTWRADFAAGGTLLQDSVETKFRVVYPTPLLREILQARPDGDADLLAGVDPTLLGGKGTVRVGVANSRIFELREGVRDLLHYPYGCVEQTTSALLPWLTLRDFREVLPELRRTDDEFKAAVGKGVARLLSMQTSDGGLAYWPGGTRSELWASAYGGFGLAMAKKHGVAASEADIDRLAEFISKHLRGAGDTNDKWQLSERTFACFALAMLGKPEEAYHELLFKKRALLTQESRAFLALSIAEAKGDKRMATVLLGMQDKKVEEDFWFGSVARAQGVRLLAWTKLSPKSDGTKAIADSVFELRKNGSWMTTQGNTWAVLGLADYIRATEAGRKEVRGSIVAGDAKADFTLAAKGQYFEKEYPIGAALKLVNAAKGRLFTQVTVEARPVSLVTKRQDRGYSIARRYQRINDDASLSDLGEPKVGDRVLVTIDFTSPQRGSYLVVDDPLPANFEAVNPEFKSQAMAVAPAGGWTSDYTEIREDRALFFRNNFWGDKHQIQYLARVRAAGTSTAPPTKVEEMYHPERFGLGDSQVIVGKAF